MPSEIKGVSTAEVLRVFDQHHPVRPENSNGYARCLLQNAAQQFGDVWAHMVLSRGDVLEIILPPHHDGRGGGQIELIQASGLTVSAATEKLRGIILSYQASNTVCWEKIAYWMGLYPSPVFLSAGPVTSNIDYQHLTDHRGHLIHLDGLHRLIAWGLSGKLDPDQYDKQQSVEAYVAGWLQGAGQQ
jgi:hypothetical protein